MVGFMEKLLNLCNSRIFKFGAPFLLLVVGGSFGLREFTSLRYQYSKRQFIKPEDLAKEGVFMKKRGEVTLETEYEKIKDLDIDNWKNIRGPRPWEQEGYQEEEDN